MSVIEKVFCDLTEYYYFNGLTLEAALNKATKLLVKEGNKNE
ncbi:hypothetical protein [Clostridium sp. D53t1_180928_C8]|nr:hypothetical protein [Clostridium sp. D53t1_180928_C8]